jgi:phospholipase C
MAPVAAAAAAGESDTNDGNTATPIKHVIVIIGENRTFDHLFATYKPVNSGETVSNCCRKASSKPMARRGPITRRSRKI